MPFIIVNVNLILFEILICDVARFVTVQEGYYIKTSYKEMLKNN